MAQATKEESSFWLHGIQGQANHQVSQVCLR